VIGVIANLRWLKRGYYILMTISTPSNQMLDQSNFFIVQRLVHVRIYAELVQTVAHCGLDADLARTQKPRLNADF
jgi:hypothetical protein